MIDEEMNILCSSCRQEIRSQDQVTLDMLYTITHADCEPTKLPVKDTALFQELQNKYFFFKYSITK